MARCVIRYNDHEAVRGQESAAIPNGEISNPGSGRAKEALLQPIGEIGTRSVHRLREQTGLGVGSRDRYRMPYLGHRYKQPSGVPPRYNREGGCGGHMSMENETTRYGCWECGEENWNREIMNKGTVATIVHVCQTCGRRVEGLQP